MSIRYGTKVRSLRTKKIVGMVVGFGTLCWMTSADDGGDGGI